MTELEVNTLMRKFSEKQFDDFLTWFKEYDNVGTISVDIATGFAKFECDIDAIFFSLVWL